MGRSAPHTIVRIGLRLPDVGLFPGHCDAQGLGRHQALAVPSPSTRCEVLLDALQQQLLGVLPDEAIRPSRGSLCEWEVLDCVIHCQRVFWAKRYLARRSISYEWERSGRGLTNHVRDRPNESKFAEIRLDHDRIRGQDDSRYRSRLARQIILGWGGLG